MRHGAGSATDRINMRLLSFLLIAGILVAPACAATKQARTVERLGFLKDLYPKMVEGNEDAGESGQIHVPPGTVASSAKIDRVRRRQSRGIQLHANACVFHPRFLGGHMGCARSVARFACDARQSMRGIELVAGAGYRGVTAIAFRGFIL